MVFPTSLKGMFLIPCLRILHPSLHPSVDPFLQIPLSFCHSISFCICETLVLKPSWLHAAPQGHLQRWGACIPSQLHFQQQQSGGQQPWLTLTLLLSLELGPGSQFPSEASASSFLKSCWVPSTCLGVLCINNRTTTSL